MPATINPVKKITPAQLRECAKKYENNPRYFASAIIKDLGIEIYNQPIFECSHILKSIADSIERYYIELPTDKDGNLLRIGQFVYAKDGTAYFVHGFSSGRRNVFLSKIERNYGAGGKASAKPYDSKEFTLVKPDSWERIVKDATWLGIRYSDAIGGDSDVGALIDQTQDEEQQLIARCRKLAGEV